MGRFLGGRLAQWCSREKPGRFGLTVLNARLELSVTVKDSAWLCAMRRCVSA